MKRVDRIEMSKAGDDQFPSVAIPGALHECAVGWDKIVTELKRGMTRSRTEKLILVVECYPGVDALAV